jgi:hypothetical protein
MEYASRVIVATQWSGSNSAEVLGMCQMVTQYTGAVWSIKGQDAERLVLHEQGTTGLRADWPVDIGQWVVVAPDFGIIARLSDGAYKARYRAIQGIVTDAVAASLPGIASSAPVQAAIRGEVAKAMYGGFGLATLPALAIGNAETNVPVTIRPAQPDTGYRAEAFAFSGGTVLSAVSVVSVTNTSTSVATVRVRNTGLLTLSGLLAVHITSAPAAPAAK